MKKKIFVLICVVVVLFAVIAVPVSALELSVDNTVTPYNTILDSYPTSNILPYPYRFRGVTTVSGVDIIVNNDMSITFDGIASSTAYNVISRMYLPAGTYTLSGFPMGTTSTIWTTVRTLEGNVYKTGDKITFNVVNDGDLVEVLISYASGYVCDAETYFLMLAKGSDALPWSPYLPYQFSIYEELGFDDGYFDGYDDGYNNGYTNGRDELADEAASSKLSAFDPRTGCSLSVYSEQVDNTLNFTLYDVPYTLTDAGTVNLSRTYQYVLAWWNSNHPNTPFYPLRIDLQFRWAKQTDIPVDERLTPTFSEKIDVISAVAPSDLTFEYMDDNGNYVDGITSYVSYNGSYLYDTTIFTGLHFFSLNFSWIYIDDTDASFLENASIITDATAPTQSYLYGFTDGYNTADTTLGPQYYEEGFDVGYDDGYSNGRADGYVVGKNEGISIAGNGDYRSLFTAVVEAPINAFMSLFSFEILGLDMRDAVAAIFTLCLVLIIVKKVIF